MHLPIRLGSLFSEAYIEMTPVISRNAHGFRFSIPGTGTSFECASLTRMDTLIRAIPEPGYMVSDGAGGFAWITRFGVNAARLTGSGYLFRRPTKQGLAKCGVRYVVRDLPKGDYAIVNWVVFPRHCIVPPAGDCMSFLPLATVSVSGKSATDYFIAASVEGPYQGRN